MIGTDSLGFSLLTSVILLSFAPCPTLTTSTQASYYSLMTDLFDSYKNEVRPTNDDTTTVVHIRVWLLSIQNLDEKNQILSTSLIIQTIWTDPWLQWDPANYGNITLFRYSQKKLWLPDVVVINTVESQRQMGYDECPLIISHTGVVEWYPSEIVQTSCDIDVTYYPFDTQICDVIISTWVSTHDQVDLDLDPNETDIVMERFSSSGTWELSETSIQSIPNDGQYTRLQYTFKLKRLSTFYVVNMILPVLFLSLTASAVFYLPSEAGEKIGMSMTVLLSYAVYLTIISENMPQTSLQISILSVYLTLLLGITAISVILSVLILHWHHTPEDEVVGMRMAEFTRTLRKVLRYTSNHTNDGNNSSSLNLLERRRDTLATTDSSTSRPKGGKISPAIVSNGRIKIDVAEKSSEMDEEEKITWPIVSVTFDTIFFVSISLFIILLTVIVLMILIIGGAYQNQREI